jgi:hypothetical protein
VVAEKKYVVWDLDVLATGQVSKALQYIDKLLRDGEQPPALVDYGRMLLEAKDLGPGANFARLRDDWECVRRGAESTAPITNFRAANLSGACRRFMTRTAG